MTFQVGDKVIYPNHGLGVVQGIETKTILGTTCGFYHLRMVANETTVLVPVDNVDGVGLRRAISDEEIERLFSLLGDGKIDNHQNWKGRFKDNSDRMRTGSIYDVVEVLKSLTFLARSKNLSFREKRMLDRAKFLVISEISEVSHEMTAAIEEKVDRALERCFTTKNRSIARAKAAKAAPTHARHGRGGPPKRRRPRSRQSVSCGRGRQAERAPALFLSHAHRVARSARSATYVAVSLYVAARRSAVRAGRARDSASRAILYQVGHGGVRLGLLLSGITVAVEGAEHIQRDRAAVYAVNHASNVEPPILFAALHELFPRLRILYKAELRKLPILVRAFDLGGLRPARARQPRAEPAGDRARRRGAARRQLVPDLSRRARAAGPATLLPFKKGGFIMALKGQAPVVPVAINGARDAMRKGSLVIQPVRVRVRFGDAGRDGGADAGRPRHARDRSSAEEGVRSWLSTSASQLTSGRRPRRGPPIADPAGSVKRSLKRCMDILTTLGRTMGFSFAAGINLYATVAILGLASRYGWVALPPQFRVFDNDSSSAPRSCSTSSSSSPTRSRGSTRCGTPSHRRSGRSAAR